MNNLDIAAYAAAQSTLNGMRAAGSSKQLTNTEKNILSGAAVLVQDAMNQIDDKSGSNVNSLVLSFVKAIGAHHVGLVAATGELPGIDQAHKDLLYGALLEAAYSYYSAKLAQ